MSGGYSTASTSAFRHLFQYISGGSENSQKIAMTAPVIVASQNSMDSDNWTVSFVMPEGKKFEELPNPTETKICRFDAPFKPGFMQYNEILAPILS